MTINFPPKLRIGLYIGTAVLTPIVAYLKVRGYIGDLEVILWSSEVAVVSSLAAFNVDTGK